MAEVEGDAAAYAWAFLEWEEARTEGGGAEAETKVAKTAKRCRTW
jgi:hypothetical protein